MSSVPELFNAIQIAILGAQKDLEKLDRPETTLEQLREFEERLTEYFKSTEGYNN